MNNYDTERGDEIDKYLFIKDVIEYLDKDIDDVNRKYNGRIGVGHRTEKANAQAMSEKRGQAQVSDLLHE